MEAAAEKSRSATVLDLQAWTYNNLSRLPAGGTYYPICMFPTNSEQLIGISDAFSAFVYGYPSISCPRVQCTLNKSVTTLRYTRRHGPVYTECSPLDFRRSSILIARNDYITRMAYVYTAGGQTQSDPRYATDWKSD